MSSLFSVRVLKVSTKDVKLVVQSIHPDSGPPAETATFALMLLFDPILNAAYSDFEEFDHLEASLLAQAMDGRDAMDEQWLRANAQAFVARVKKTGPSLTVTPTHPAWISHMRRGMYWETAAYNCGPGTPAVARTPAPAGVVAAHGSDPAAGFAVKRPKIEGCKLTGAFVPLHGPGHYVADPVIEDPEAMRKAMRKLLGQPLLVVPKRGPVEVGTNTGSYKEGFQLYHESTWSWGTHSVAFDELKSLGRAWLKDPPPATADGTATKAGSKKKTAKSAGTANKATTKSAGSAKRATTKKTAKKTTAANKATNSKKTAAKKGTANKTTTAAKKTVGKTTTAANKTIANKATVSKKTAAKKTTANKTTAAAKKAVGKATASRTTTAKKTAAKKSTAKKSTKTAKSTKNATAKKSTKTASPTKKKSTKTAASGRPR